MVAEINEMGVIIKHFLGDHARKQNRAQLLQFDQMNGKWA